MSDLPLRPRSTRTSARAHRYNGATSARPAPKPTEIFPGLNDVTDAMEALPVEVIKYFTLLKEVDAKSHALLYVLKKKIKEFKAMENKPELERIRTKKSDDISNLVMEVFPCLEEKMLVASFLAEKTETLINRIKDDYVLIFKNEIPENTKYGSMSHPAIVSALKNVENKSAQSQRSESRREALAARKAANDTENEESSKATNTAHARGPKSRKEKDTTPVSSTTATTSKKRKPNNSSSHTQSQGNSIHANSASSNSSNNAITHALKKEEEQISRPSTPSNKKSRANNRKKTEQSQQSQQSHSKSSSSNAQSANSNDDQLLEDDAQKKNNDETLYCYCNQVSYGEMVGCDGDDCKREWFHLPCTGLDTLPKGQWYCNDCSAKIKKTKRA